MNSESTIGSFITMMEQFIDELSITFPNETKIKVYKNSFDMLKKTNPRRCLACFWNTWVRIRNRL